MYCKRDFCKIKNIFSRFDLFWNSKFITNCARKNCRNTTIRQVKNTMLVTNRKTAPLDKCLLGNGKGYGINIDVKADLAQNIKAIIDQE
jgi:hypothetical protein